MNRAFLAASLGGLLLAGAGCKPKADNNEAIRDGVIKHLSGMSGLNVNNMIIMVTKATVNGDHAQADVEVRAKNGEPGAPPMELTYQLQKQGKEWMVLKGQATGGMRHPAPGELPLQEAMPAGHPPLGGANGQMPANHPDFNSILNSAAPPAQTQAQPQPLKGQQTAPQRPASDAKP
jgi:hypothetical protein